MKTLLSISIFLLSLNLSYSQALAEGQGDATDRVEMDNTEDALHELRTKVFSKLVVPSDSRTGKTIVDVKIDAAGKIVEHNIVRSLGRDFDKAIEKALKSVVKITPIIIDDQASDQVIRLPIQIED